MTGGSSPVNERGLVEGPVSAECDARNTQKQNTLHSVRQTTEGDSSRRDDIKTTKSHRLRRGIRRSSSNLPDGSAWCTSAASSETPERHHRYVPYRTIVRPRQQPETTTYCLTVCKNTAQKTRTILANNPAPDRTPTAAVHSHRDRVLPDGVGPGVPNFAQHAQVRLVQGVQPQGSHLRHVRAQRPVDTCPPTKRHNKHKFPAGEISRKKKKRKPPRGTRGSRKHGNFTLHQQQQISNAILLNCANDQL